MKNFASWNVNSINARLEHVLQWLDNNDIDVLGLQELKCQDEQFPFDEFFARGYEVVVSGQKSYNGVGFISRVEATDIITDIANLDCPQRRILAASFGDYRVINLYVPNGQSLTSDKYPYKLDWLAKVSDFIHQQLKEYPRLMVMGDFNIAPGDEDVYDVKEWKDEILVSGKERAALQHILAHGLCDSFRLFKQKEDSFSWWDYRAASFRQNKGLRIDLILLSQQLAQHCQNSSIDTIPRTWIRPSDHAPVFVNLQEED